MAKFAIVLPDDVTVTVDGEVRAGKRLAWDESGYYLDDERIAEYDKGQRPMSENDASGALIIRVGSHVIRLSKDPFPELRRGMTFDEMIAMLEAEGARCKNL